MKPIKIRKHVDSETLHIPELREMVGQDVEITIQPSGAGTDPQPLETLETFLGDALHREPLSEAELAELRVAAADDPALAAALRIAERGGLDVETIVANRSGSPT